MKIQLNRDLPATYIKTQEKIVCGSSYMDLVEINSCPSFLVEMLIDLNAPNDCAAISQKYRERAYQEACDIDVLLNSGRVLDFAKKRKLF
ncbi:hypothetical protein [Bartonella grahamii]|uniref:hypothetical protein n=1 Tax=Bartonella grahamii TaxID=33045 RepID=UPI00117BE4CB|nr:hypothetical protein [Bartonella grahamii]